VSTSSTLRRWLLAALALSVLLGAAWLYFNGWGERDGDYGAQFDAERAFADLAYQVALGPRPSGGPAQAEMIAWLTSSLEDCGWGVEVQRAQIEGQAIQNVVAQRGVGAPWIILGAHYDTRLLADQDPDPEKRDEPVLGANDGASGVAVLLELARVLPPDWPGQVWLVFFDAEDNGDIPGWDWILGSRAFVEALEGQPDGVVIVDMIGDANLQLYLERSSTAGLAAAIWAQATQLGYGEVFIPLPKYHMLDDHTPFLQAGIEAVDIIDFDYPYWHTTEDTLDKVSAESLDIVGETLLAWLLAMPEGE